MPRKAAGFLLAVLAAAAIGTLAAFRSIDAIRLAPFAVLIVLPLAAVLGLPTICLLHRLGKTSLAWFFLGGVVTGLVYTLIEVLRICLTAEDATLGLVQQVLLTYGTVGVAASVAGALTYWAVVVSPLKR